MQPFEENDELMGDMEQDKPESEALVAQLQATLKHASQRKQSLKREVVEVDTLIRMTEAAITAYDGPQEKQANTAGGY